MFYTDGAMDALDATGAQFGIERLRQAVVAERHNPAQVICDKLLDRISAFRADTPQYDDITLVAVQVLPFVGVRPERVSSFATSSDGADRS